jgi:hypothetical protein
MQNRQLRDPAVDDYPLRAVTRVGCTYSIFLQIGWVPGAAESVHRTGGIGARSVTPDSSR